MPEGADPDVRSATETELLRAVSLGDVDSVRVLLGNQVDKCILSKALTSAAQAGTKELVILFLDAGADINFRQGNLETPLVAAAEAGNMEVVQVMVQHSPNEGGRQLALQRAIRKNRNFDMILELLRLPRDMKLEEHATGIDLLGIAADAGYEEVVQYLLLNDVSQIKPRSRWTSALHLAAARGHTNIVQILIEAPPQCGVDHRVRNPGGLTPLMVACYNNQPQTASYLVRHSSARELEIQDDRRATALHWAIVKTRNVDLVRQILQKGADPDIKWDNNETPLILALKIECPEIAKCLIEEGADICVCDANGQSPFYYAKEVGYADLLADLRIDEPNASAVLSTSTHHESFVDSNFRAHPETSSSSRSSFQQDSSAITSRDAGNVSKPDSNAPISNTRNLLNPTESWQSLDDLKEAIKLGEIELLSSEYHGEQAHEMYMSLLQRLMQLSAASSGDLALNKMLLGWLQKMDDYVPTNCISDRREIQYFLAFFMYRDICSSEHRLRSIPELNRVLTFFWQVAMLYPADTQQRKGIVWFFTILCRFRIDLGKEGFPELDRSLSLVNEALCIHQQLPQTEDIVGHRELIEFVLTDLYSLRYKQANEIEALISSINHRRNAVMRSPHLWQRYPGRLFDLGNELETLYRRTGSIDVLKESVNAFRDYIKQVDDSEEGLVLGKNGLAHALWSLYQAESNFENLKEARELVERAVALVLLCPRWRGGHIHGEILTNHANILDAYYEILHNIADLNDSLRVGQESLSMFPNQDSSRAIRLTNLANKYKMLYERSNKVADLNLGISAATKSVNIRHKELSVKCLALNSLGNLITIELQRVPGSISDYNRLVRIRKLAAGFESNPPSRVDYLHNLATSLTDRYDKFRNIEDLNESIRYGFQCLRLSPARNRNRSMYLTNQAQRFAALFDREKSAADLDIAIAMNRRAVLATPNYWVAVLNLAAALSRQWNEIDRSNTGVLRQAGEYFESIIDMSTTPMLRRLDCSIRASICALGLDDTEKSSALLKRVVQMLPQLYTPLANRQDLHYVLRHLKGLPARVASTVLGAGKPVAEALENMEAARGITAYLTVSVHQPSEKSSPLQEKHDNNTLHGLTRQLQNPESNETLPGNNRSTINRDERSNTDHEVRPKDTRFDAFLSAQEAISLAGNDFIVDFVIHDTPRKQYAIVVGQGVLNLVELPDVSYEYLQNAAKHFIGPDRITQGSQSSWLERNNQMRIDLLWLWKDVVKPVLASFDLQQELTARSSLPRVHWISSGLIGLMPFHAAGNGILGSMENTMEHVVSSYVPSLKAMRYIKARFAKMDINVDPKALFVGVPKAPGSRYIDLTHSVESEWESIKESFPTPTQLLSPKVLDTFTAMSTSNILHFTCHGEMDPQNPSNSRLLLGTDSETDPLTIEDLSRRSFSNLFLVFLAACSTAEVGAEDLLDEVVHLASAFQLVGFPHVIGTLWRVNDKISADLVRDFYRRLSSVGKGFLDDGVVAQLLHDCVLELRRKKGQTPIAWAPYIHFGL